MGGDDRFPDGTIRPQLPFFRAALPIFDSYFDAPVFPATLNLAVDGCAIRIGKPTHFLPDIKWTDRFPPESFYLSPCAIIVADRRYRGLLYIPDAATKPDHVQPANVVEVLSAHIPALRYGDAVQLVYALDAIEIRPA